MLMFRKPVQCNCFVYYGIIASEGEVTSAMRRMKVKLSIDDFIHQQGLDYRRIGNAEKSAKFVIGRELYEQKAFTHMKLDVNDNSAVMYHNTGIPIKVSLSVKEKYDISNKIYKIGFFNLTEYYLVHNYEFNEI